MGCGGHIIKSSNLSEAWVQALTHIIDNGGESLNLMVQISDPRTTEGEIDGAFNDLAVRYGLLNARHVAYTIFPDSLYHRVNRERHKLYERYNRMYPRIKTQWGTYFKRMIDWPFGKETAKINQLELIISKLISRTRVARHAYTILICSPERNFGQPRGGPCLNYLTLQINSKERRISLLAVYRNHDFIGRAYGNYIGLSNLLSFICEQSDFQLGWLTTLSSHAYIEPPPSRKELTQFLEGIR